MTTKPSAKTTAKTVKPYKIGDELFTQYHVEGSPYAVGERVSVFSVRNLGSKREPYYRYYVRGAWYDHEALGTSNPLED